MASVGTNLTGYARSSTPVAPTLTLADSGDYTEHNFNAFCWIDSAGTRVYNDSVAVDSVVLGGTATGDLPELDPGTERYDLQRNPVPQPGRTTSGESTTPCTARWRPGAMT